jgi:hypothetical protein
MVSSVGALQQSIGQVLDSAIGLTILFMSIARLNAETEIISTEELGQYIPHSG